MKLLIVFILTLVLCNLVNSKITFENKNVDSADRKQKEKVLRKID